jgi:hypothetical protein
MRDPGPTAYAAKRRVGLGGRRGEEDRIRWRLRRAEVREAEARHPAALAWDPRGRHIARVGRGSGRVIPHAGGIEEPASSSIALTIAVIESAFRARTMAAAGTAQARRTRFGGTSGAAVDVAPVAVSANGEDGLAAWASGQPCWLLPTLHDRSSDATTASRSTLPDPPKTCDNPGRSSLCLEDRGSSTRGLGAATPGPHLLQATVGQKPDGTPPAVSSTNAPPGAPEARLAQVGRRFASGRCGA